MYALMAEWCIHPEMKGSYSTTDNGIPHVHESIAEFIERRDGVRSDPENIIFSTGLEKALWVRCILECLHVWDQMAKNFEA